MIKKLSIFLFAMALGIKVASASCSAVYYDPLLKQATCPQSGGVLYYSPSGNVGIGSTSPGQALDVHGTVRAGTLTATNSGASTFNGNVGIGTATPGGALEINTGNNVIVRTGNVGIGKAPSLGPLDIVGDSYITGTAHIANNVVQILSSEYVFNDANHYDFWNSGNGPINLKTTGNVGINSTLPGTTLDVQGTVRVSNGGNFATNVGIGTSTGSVATTSCLCKQFSGGICTVAGSCT